MKIVIRHGIPMIATRVFNNGMNVGVKKKRIKSMNADELFEAILKAILHTDIDFEQVYVGDEESGEVYFKFCKVSEDQTNDDRS